VAALSLSTLFSRFIISYAAVMFVPTEIECKCTPVPSFAVKNAVCQINIAKIVLMPSDTKQKKKPPHERSKLNFEFEVLRGDSAQEEFFFITWHLFWAQMDSS
jgi:hypothetical protein